MSAFSCVDGAPDPNLLVSYLDYTARAASGMKHYAMAAHALRHPDGPILDIGCGAGHDLALLASAGLQPVGVDPSATLLRTAAQRTSAPLLVQATGEALPFHDGSVAGCRIERVLMHVVDPLSVLIETVRCLRAGALLSVFEPNFDSLTVRNDHGDDPVRWLARVRHPGIGGNLWDLVANAGCVVLDRVEELSVWRKRLSR
jgi:SAM-dependent methyltransferase